MEEHDPWRMTSRGGPSQWNGMRLNGRSPTLQQTPSSRRSGSTKPARSHFSASQFFESSMAKVSSNAFSSEPAVGLSVPPLASFARWRGGGQPRVPEQRRTLR